MVLVRQAGVLLLAALISSRGLFAQDGATRDSLDQVPATVTATAADEVKVLLRPVEIRYMQQEDVLLPRAANIKGLYVNAWAFGSSKLWQLVRLADETEVNAFVIGVNLLRGARPRSGAPRVPGGAVRLRALPRRAARAHGHRGFPLPPPG